MTNPFSMSMVFSSDDKPQNVSSGVKLCKTNNVRDYKRSRFDEAESYKQKTSNMALRVCKIQRRSKNISEPLEIEILRDILNDHPRIVRLYDVIMHTNTMQLYFDYYPGGDLFKLMARYFDEWQPMPESFLWHCFLQISEGLAYIHHGYDRRQLGGPPHASEWQPIIHGDIKPENIFLGAPTPDSHGYPSLVLGDFGLATIDEISVSGTWKWQPPELPMTSKKADVWALGAVIHALAHDGRPPLRPRPDGMAPCDFYRWPGARLPTSLLGIYTTELHDLVIHGALQFNPEARYSSLELLQCVVVEVELGVASDIGWEPLLGSGLSVKTYDENGVTEDTTVSSDDTFQTADAMSLKEIEPKPFCDPDPMSLKENESMPYYDPMEYCVPMEYENCY